MGELIILGVLLWWIFSAVSKGKKKPKPVKPAAPIPAQIEELSADAEGDEDDEYDEGDEDDEDAVEQLTMLDVPAQPEEPAALAPQAVLSSEGMGTGRSMQAGVPEGIDPCHPGGTDIRRRMARRERRADDSDEWMQPAPQTGGFEPDFSPEAMRQAVVMREILMRPCERRRRR